jgi:DNA-binding Xre family transcriptional regulator
MAMAIAIVHTTQEGTMSTIRVNVPRLLRDRGVKPFDLVRFAGIAPGTAYRLADEEKAAQIKGITFDVLSDLCQFLDVSVSDILEYEPDNK